MPFRSALAVALLLLSQLTFASPEAEFIEKWQDKGLSEQYIRSALEKAERKENILAAIKRPWEAKPWYQYYPLFLTEERLEAGLQFWQEHQADLARAEKELGVEAEIIVAIIGVETYYGRHLGKHKVLDSLYTLGFHYPPRQTFFRSELGHFLALAQEQQWPLDSIKGSYAGAMGFGQFIPSSYRAYAIDFDSDGKIDLLTNPTDAIGSVANYFVKHRWEHGQPVAESITPADPSKLAAVSWDGKPLKHSPELLKENGIDVGDDVSGPLAVLPLKASEDEMKYFLVHPNFYSITRYNHSPLYAMAVWQFSQQLKKGRQ